MPTSFASTHRSAPSTLFMNLAAALIAADAYRIFVQAIADLTTALWTLEAMLLIVTG